MLKGIYIKMTEQEKAELQRLIEYVQSEKKDDSFAVYTTEDKVVTVIRLVLNDLKVNVSDDQIKTIYRAQTENVEEIANAVLALHKEKVDPSLIFVLQTSFCIAALLTAPELMAVYSAKELAKRFAQTKMGKYHWYTNGVLQMADLLILAAGQYFNSLYFNPTTLLNNKLPDIAKVSFFTHLPTLVIADQLVNKATVPLQKLVTNPRETLTDTFNGTCKVASLVKQVALLPLDEEFNETAGDFFDIMYGRADDATIEKYKGSFATKPIDEVVNDVFGGVCKGINWLRNHAPNFRANAQAPIAATATASSTRGMLLN